MKSLFSVPSARPSFLRAVACAAAISLAACTANPTPLDRPGDLPDTFTAPIDKTAPIWPQADWWSRFGTDELAPLEAISQKENLDIEMAAARIIQSEAQDGVALAALFPNLGGTVAGTRQGSNRGIPRATNNFNAGLNASYQQGFFGTQYLNLRAARESLRAARYAAAVIGISVASQVADQYFNILSLRERIAINKENVAAARRILSTTQAKVASGVSSNLDLAEQQAIVAQQESRLPGLIEAEREARYALAILLGRAPEGYDIQAQNLDGIVSPALQPGMPSQLLLRNPSVAQAEAQLYAAHANVDAARAAYFPFFNLNGSSGFGAAMIGSLFGPAGFAWSIGGSIVQTIFDGGRVHAQNDFVLGQQRELIANYRKVVFTAFSDVESALGSVKSNTDQLSFIDTQTKASAEAFRISELQYREGTIDILSLLTNQQNLFNAQDTLVQTKLARLEANLALYNALGGGWEQKADDAAYKNQLDWWPL